MKAVVTGSYLLLVVALPAELIGFTNGKDGCNLERIIKGGVNVLFEVSSLLIILFLVGYIFILQNKVTKLEDVQAKNLHAHKDPDLDSKIAAMFNDGRTTVEIVRFVRKETNLGLVQAKLYVDDVLNQ